MKNNFNQIKQNKIIYFLFFSPSFSPWPSRDSNGFLINVRTSPLRFPYDKPIG